MSHPKAGPAETATLNAANQTQAERTGEVNQLDTGLAPFQPGPGGDFTTTPLYKSEVATGREATGNAYRAAQAATNANAHAAGYGYGQPATQTADASIQAQEATQMADVPRYALSDVANKSLSADQIRSGMVSSLNPSSDFNTATNAEVKRETTPSGLSSLIKTGVGIGSMFIPGVGPAIGASILGSQAAGGGGGSSGIPGVSDGSSGGGGGGFGGDVVSVPTNTGSVIPGQPGYTGPVVPGIFPGYLPQNPYADPAFNGGI